MNSIWVHGNTAIVESPEHAFRVEHRGWGTQIFFGVGYQTWVHVPLPTPTTFGDSPARLDRVHLTFSANLGKVVAVDVYDGVTVVAKAAAIAATGPNYTLTLPHPHTVTSAVGISFLLESLAGVDDVPPIPEAYLTITAAGADYEYVPVFSRAPHIAPPEFVRPAAPVVPPHRGAELHPHVG